MYAMSTIKQDVEMYSGILSCGRHLEILTDKKNKINQDISIKGSTTPIPNCKTTVALLAKPKQLSPSVMQIYSQ